MPIYTTLYASLLALLILLLAAMVSKTRRRLKIGIGTKGNKEMALAVRVHANAVEYIPMSLLLMLFAELSGAEVWMLHTIGVGLLISRLMHAYGLGSSVGISFGRFYGTALNWLIIIVLAIFNIIKASQIILS